MQNTLADATNLQILCSVILENHFFGSQAVILLTYVSAMSMSLSSSLVIVERRDKQSTAYLFLF